MRLAKFALLSILVVTGCATSKLPVADAPSDFGGIAIVGLQHITLEIGPDGSGCLERPGHTRLYFDSNTFDIMTVSRDIRSGSNHAFDAFEPPASGLPPMFLREWVDDDPNDGQEAYRDIVYPIEPTQVDYISALFNRAVSAGREDPLTDALLNDLSSQSP